MATQPDSNGWASRNMGWLVPLAAFALSIAGTMSATSFNNGNDKARMDNFEQQLITLNSKAESVDKTYSVITNQMTEFGGKLDLIVNDISYIKRDYGDMKLTTGNITSDVNELKLYVLTQGKEGDLNGH